MSASRFDRKLFKFLEDLDRNNNKAWFEKNKSRYIEEVRDPVLAFITDFGPRLRRLSHHLVADPRPVGGSMFRIYRDTRFSKDKRPYKTNAGAQFRHARAKDVHSPGCYLHLGTDGVFAASGIWHPDGESLARIRRVIAESPSRWKRLLSSPAFRKGRLELGGASLKRPPRGFDPDHPFVEDLKRTDFYVWTGLTRKDACSKGFIDRYAAHCRDSLPFMKFLARSLDLPL
jgi:uncharacterized protein (TIGR02453 family)